MAFISETKPRRANLTSFDHMDLGHRTLLWQHIFSLQVVEAMEATEAKPTSTIQMQCCSSAIEVLNLNKPILLQDYFNTSNLQCWSSVIEVLKVNKIILLQEYFNTSKLQYWSSAIEVLVYNRVGEGLQKYWCRVVLALLFFQDYLFLEVLTLFQQTPP